MPSFRFCRPKNSSTLPENPIPFTYRLSPVNRRKIDITYPNNFPAPPASTPDEDWSIICNVSSDRFSQQQICKERYECEKDSQSSVIISSSRSFVSNTKNREIRKMPPACTVEGNKVSESFAVVKKSKDPYEDFKRSMLEMIMEKEIFESKELEELLQCFLALNSRHYREIIVHVFTEIWELLFCESDPYIFPLPPRIVQHTQCNN
ncbi:Transcription repressor like [Quillaja saponaria]|uniref:Transcription repressor n=1 Tax=Quillaja saponaria TaxID=32244 RepID=A0AAD7LYL8_QUISA|nr:Transcription repressor like [Quillaja saponaria]